LAKHSGLTYKDVRPSLYGLPGNALITGLLSTKLTKDCLLRETWWKDNAELTRKLGNRQHHTDEFVNNNKMSVYILFFSFYESVIRELVRGLLPGACNDAYDPFANVYGALLKRVDLQRHSPLLDFARTMRNLIHNNGFFLNKQKRDESHTFNGTVYFFEHDKPVRFALATVLYEIYEQALNLSDDLNTHPDIIALAPRDVKQP